MDFARNFIPAVSPSEKRIITTPRSARRTTNQDCAGPHPGPLPEGEGGATENDWSSQAHLIVSAPEIEK